jgi:hypothetical protein
VALLITALMFIPRAYGGGVSMEGGTSIEASGSAQGYSVADDSGAISDMSPDGVAESFESALGISPTSKPGGKILEKTSGATDGTGKHAETYVKVVNGQGVSYSSKILPKEVNPKKSVWPLLNQEPSISIETALGGHPCIMLSIDDTPHLVAV